MKTSFSNFLFLLGASSLPFSQGYGVESVCAAGESAVSRQGDGSTHEIGYKQVNTLLSDAWMQIINDGTYGRIRRFNSGLPGGGVQSNIADTSLCRREWDPATVPMGILDQAVKTGKFIWCTRDTDYRPLEEGGIAPATEANELQGVEVGDLVGWQIDVFKSLTIQMSKILHAPLEPEYFVANNTGAGVIADYYAVMGSDLCYATNDLWIVQPAREAAFDFTCLTRAGSELGPGIMGLEETDLAEVFSAGGEGYSICVFPGTVQATAAEGLFPNATFVEVDSVDATTVGVCTGLCDAVVDDIVQAQDIFGRYAACAGLTLGEPQTVPSPSSGGGGGALTYRPSCN